LPITVQNTGNTTSDFVTLGFISGQYGTQPYPIKTLVAYDRLHDVQPGTSRTAMLNLTLESLGRVDEMGNTVLYPGDYSILVDVPTQVSDVASRRPSSPYIEAPADPEAGCVQLHIDWRRSHS